MNSFNLHLVKYVLNGHNTEHNRCYYNCLSEMLELKITELKDNFLDMKENHRTLKRIRERMSPMEDQSDPQA